MKKVIDACAYTCVCVCIASVCCCIKGLGQISMLHFTEKRQRERRRSSTPPIPEEPEDADSDYMSGGSPSPTEQQQHAAATIHRQHAPPSRSDTRTSTGFREPRVTWHHEGPAITGGGAQYPGVARTLHVRQARGLQTVHYAVEHVAEHLYNSMHGWLRLQGGLAVALRGPHPSSPPPPPPPSRHVRSCLPSKHKRGLLRVLLPV